MKQLLCLVSLLLATGWAAQAQTLTHGPVVGGVTHQQAVVYVRIVPDASFEIRYGTDSANLAAGQTASGSTRPDEDHTALVTLTGLTPGTRYFYQVTPQGGSPSPIQTFRSFPTPGTAANATFVFGSCLRPDDTAATPLPLFREILNHNPDLMLFLGDWGYPDSTTGRFIYSEDYGRVQQAYRSRYAYADARAVFARTPLAYTWDDHDYTADNSSARTRHQYSTKPFADIPVPEIARTNVIKGYVQNFPAYDLPDTSQGIYHSFRYGNVEFFMLDSRANRSPNNEAIDMSSSAYRFSEPPGHTFLGQQQFQWLLDGLKNSTATWKVLVNGTTFNLGFRNAINAISGNTLIQNLTVPGFGTGAAALGALVDCWAGFQREQDALLNHLATHNIKNVIHLSGDTHNGAIDDGTNAGIPELMSGNLHINNSRIASLLAQAGGLLQVDLNMWNMGGQGIGNQNFSYTFGKIEVFGDDSMRLSLVDTLGGVIATLLLCDGVGRCPEAPDSRGAELPMDQRFRAWPNPTTERLTVEFIPRAGEQLGAANLLRLFDLEGRVVRSLPGTELHQGTVQLSLADLPAGLYFLRLDTATGPLVRSVIKQ